MGPARRTVTDGEEPAIPEHSDEFAETYAEYAAAPIREHLTWPAIRSLLLAVAGASSTRAAVRAPPRVQRSKRSR